MTQTNSISELADRVIASCDASIAKCKEVLATLERLEALDKEHDCANAKSAHQIDATSAISATEPAGILGARGDL